MSSSEDSPSYDELKKNLWSARVTGGSGSETVYSEQDLEVNVVIDHVGPPTPSPPSSPKNSHTRSTALATDDGTPRSVSFSGIPAEDDEDDDDNTLTDTIPDEDKTHGELIMKIQALLGKLKQSQIEAVEQRKLKKQKEKHLAKLARELKRRNDKHNEDLETIQFVSVPRMSQSVLAHVK